MVYRYIIRIRRFEQVSNGIDRSQILNQLRVILPPQEYEACVGLSDAELSEKLREALSNNSNMGVGDSFTRNFNAMPEILTPRQPQKPILPTLSVEAQIPQLTTEQAQDIAMQNLWAMNSDLARAQRELDRDKINESTSMLISREARGLYYLDRARSPQGLTKKEYLEGMKGDLRTMLITTFPDLEGRNINLDERLDSLDTEQIQMLQKALLTAEAGRLDKNEVLRMFADATQIVETVTFTTDGQTHTEARTKVKPPYSMSGGEDEKLSFEELYRVERGTDFNPDNIRQYLIDGTVSFFENPFENGFPSLEELEKHNQYQQHLPASYISSFGQPYRAEYLSVLKGSDYDTSTAYGVTPVKLDGQLTPSDEGMEFVIPTRDLTQGANVRELNPDELKRFSANMLYNILNTTYNMLKGYYDGAWEQLKSGSVGTAAVQGFLGFGEMLSGQDLTVRSQMDNVEGLLAKAAQLKNMDDNAFEQHFDELFREISGTSFDPAAMQNFAQLTMKGIKTDTDEYSEAVTRAFGSNRTGDAETQFSILNPINSVVDVVAFLAGSEVLGSTKLFAQIGSKSLQLTTKAVTRLGFNPASKGVQAGVRLISSSPVSAMNLMGYTAITETGGTVLSNLAEKYGLVKPQGEYISVMDSDRKEDDDLIRILVDMTKQGAMGSIAPFIGAFANKTGTKLATAFSKGNPSAIQRSFSAITEAEGKTLNAQTLMNNYLSSLDASALTKAQEVIAKSSGFLTEVAGFTGYSTLEHIAEGLITGELDLDSIDLGEEFKGQLEGLATLKGVARFIQMRKSGSVARGVQDKALNDMTEQLKNYDITDVGGQYRVLDKTSGKFETFNSPEQAINHLFQTMLFKSVVAKAEQANDGATDGVEWRKMNIGGEEVEVAVTKSADGKETVDFSKARKLNANGEYEHFALTTERDLLSGEGENTQAGVTNTKEYLFNIVNTNLDKILANESLPPHVRTFYEIMKKEIKSNDYDINNYVEALSYIGEMVKRDNPDLSLYQMPEDATLVTGRGATEYAMGITSIIRTSIETGKPLEFMPEQQTAIDILNNTFNTIPATTGVTMEFRGASVFRNSKSYANYTNLKPGDTYTEDGFIWTSPSKGYAQGGYGNSNELKASVKISILVPENSKVLYADRRYPETLFPMDSQFRVIDKKVDADGNIELFVEHIPIDRTASAQSGRVRRSDAPQDRAETTRIGVESNELPAPNPARRPHSTEPTPEDPFGFKGNFDAEILNLTGNDILVQIGVDKEGKPIKKISDEYEELIMDIARQIREVALSQEGGPKKIGDVDDPNYDYTQDKGIVGIMHRLGLTQNSQFFHRSKSVQSLHDKIQNALIQNPEKPLDALIGKEVRDAVGVRSVRESANLNNDKDIMALVNAGDRKSAIDLAIEKESAFVLDALKRYIDSVEAGTNEVEITSISNYMGEDGIPFFTERQLNELKVYAESKNVNLPIVQRVLSYTERAEGADVFREKATTKVRGSGYTALQMNFRTKDGFVYEWQYRGSSVNNFAEGEHIPYDLRTNKDIIGKNEELHDLFDPIKTLLSEENMSEPQFEEYNNYLTAHYEYLRLTELGFVDGKNPPKLPMGFDPRLRAENLELLHEKAEETKKHPKEKDRIYKEYTDEIARREQANPDNYTTDSYTELAEKKKASRTISKDEAEVRLGRNLDNSNPQDIAEIVEACRNSEGAISEYYIAEAESLLKIGLGKDDVLLYFKALKGPSTTVSTERTAPAEPKPQERTPEEFEAYIQTQRNLEAWAVNDLKALYEKNGVIVEEFFNQKTPDGKPRFSEWDIMYVFKRENKDFCINLLETTDINDNFKFDIDVLKRINKLLENNPHRAEINSYIEHHLLNNDDIDGNKIKLFVESLDNNSTETDFKVLSKILTDKTVPDNKKADIIASYKDLSPEQKAKLCDNYCNGNKTGFSDAFQITTGEKASGESQDIENLIKNTSALEGLSPYDIEELKECNFNQVKECIDTLEYFINKNPNASVRDRQYLLSLQKTALQQGVMLDTKSIIDNDLLNDVKLLESVIETPSAKDVNDAQYLRFKALAEIDYSDPETFRNNKKYILTSGLRTDTDVIGNMRNGIDYRKRQAELAGVNTDDITRAVLQGTKDITDIRGIERTVNQIKNILGEIRHPEMISDVLNRLNIQDYNEFNEFIKGIDIKELHRIAPRTREFNEKDLAVFLGFHYKNGTKEFNSNTLKTEKDLTEFLAKHYLDASSMSDMLAAYPLTDRNIGNMPAGWLTNVSGNQNIDKQVHNAIDDFRQTKNINTLKSTLSNLLHKNVNIEDLGSGVYGQGFKIEVEGSEPVVLKLFFETPDIGIERSLHGQTVETQTGLFLNHNSNRFVHTYFGRICGHSDHDGFMVTQYMDEGVTPVITAGNNNNYSITPTDVHKGHNEVNNIIFDLGGTLIKGKDGKNISFDVLKHKKDN